MPNSGKKSELEQHYNDTTLASYILCLTRVTRIFQKSVFTQNYAGMPGRDTAPGFLLRGRDAAARGVFVRIETKETSHAVSEG